MKNTVIFVLILETYITYVVNLLNKNTKQMIDRSVYSAMTVTNWKSGTESWRTNHWH